MVPKRQFNLQEKLKMLKEKDLEEDNKQVIDPFSVKVKKLPKDMTEKELNDMMSQFGTVTRCRIPKDEVTGENRNIGFISFKKPEEATRAVEAGKIRDEYAELPIEAAT